MHLYFYNYTPIITLQQTFEFYRSVCYLRFIVVCHCLLLFLLVCFIMSYALSLMCLFVICFLLWFFFFLVLVGRTGIRFTTDSSLFLLLFKLLNMENTKKSCHPIRHIMHHLYIYSKKFMALERASEEPIFISSFVFMLFDQELLCRTNPFTFILFYANVSSINDIYT